MKTRACRAARVETQAQRAHALFAEGMAAPSGRDVEALGLVLEQAQNAPPHGEADGSIPPATYDLMRAAHQIAKRYVEAATRAHAALIHDSMVATQGEARRRAETDRAARRVDIDRKRAVGR